MNQTRRSTFGTWVAIGLLLAVVAYPLSVGPALWLVGRGVISEECIETVYSPLEALANGPEPVQAAYLAYLRCWGIETDAVADFPLAFGPGGVPLNFPPPQLITAPDGTMCYAVPGNSPRLFGVADPPDGRVFTRANVEVDFNSPVGEPVAPPANDSSLGSIVTVGGGRYVSITRPRDQIGVPVSGSPASAFVPVSLETEPDAAVSPVLDRDDE